jgi:hypothetical protein
LLRTGDFFRTNAVDPTGGRIGLRNNPHPLLLQTKGSEMVVKKNTKKESSQTKKKAPSYEAIDPTWSVDQLSIMAESEYEQFSEYQHRAAIHARRLGHTLDVLFSKPEMEKKIEAWYSKKGRPSQATGDRCRRLWEKTKAMSEKDLGGLSIMEAYYKFDVMTPPKKKNQPTIETPEPPPPEKEEQGVVYCLAGAEMDIILAIKKFECGVYRDSEQDIAQALERLRSKLDELAAKCRERAEKAKKEQE